MIRSPRSHTPALLALALATVTFALLSAPSARAAADERPAIQSVLEHAGLLADPFGAAAEPSTFGTLRVSNTLASGAPRVEIAYGMPDASGRPASATVTVQRWLTGTLDIRQADARGRDQLVRKDVRDS